MTVEALIAFLEEQARLGRGKSKVTVETFGTIGGYNVPVKNPFSGFDWTQGQLVLRTDRPMTLYVHRKKR